MPMLSFSIRIHLAIQLPLHWIALLSNLLR